MSLRRPLKCGDLLYDTGGRGGLVAKACPTPCDPMDCSLPGSPLYISQARILERVAISFSSYTTLKRAKSFEVVPNTRARTAGVDLEEGSSSAYGICLEHWWLASWEASF